MGEGLYAEFLVEMLSVMDDPAEAQVHYTSYNYRESNSIIVIYNITLPVNIVHNLNERLIHLQRAKELILDDFSGHQTPIVFQVTGSYSLISNDNIRQIWTGSFYTNHLNNPSQIQAFQRFDENTFVDSSNVLLDNAEAILRRNGDDSEWSFEELYSIIFNFQVKLAKNDLLVERRNIRPNQRIQRNFGLL